MIARRISARYSPRSLAALAALLLLATLYFALGNGIVSTNDGSHYALTKALAADRTARIDAYVDYAAIQPRRGRPAPDDYRDVSYYDGHFYSDRPPGTAFLAVPFYWTGQLVDAISGREDVDFPLRYATMLPPLLGALTALALYALARGLGASRVAATLAAAIAALTTLLLKYATMLYSHVTAAACVTGGLALLLAAERQARPRPQRWLLLASGAALGYGAVAEYPNLLLIVPVGAYLLWRWWTRATDGAGTAGPDRGGLLAFLAGWAAPVCLLLGYNWAVFGRPWATSYTYHYYFEWARHLDTIYVTPLARGLRGLLFGDGRTTGLLAITPVLALALWGLFILARRDRTGRARAALLAGVVLAILVPTALHRTYYGGGSRDTRYLLAIVPVLCAPLALWLDAVARARSRLMRLGGALLMLGLSGWGLARAYLSLFSMFGHPAVERPPLEALAILRDHWREPAFVAPSLWLTPYFLVLAVPLAGLAWLAWAGWSLMHERAQAGADPAARRSPRQTVRRPQPAGEGRGTEHTAP